MIAAHHFAYECLPGGVIQHLDEAVYERGNEHHPEFYVIRDNQQTDGEPHYELCRLRYIEDVSFRIAIYQNTAHGTE